MSSQSVVKANVSFPSQLEIAGIVAALLPFICHFTEKSTTTVNGKVIEETSVDYVAILAGLAAIGIAAGILVTIFPNTAANDRLKRIGVTVLIAAIGAYQLVVRSGLL